MTSPKRELSTKRMKHKRVDYREVKQREKIRTERNNYIRAVQF